jgi:hypothetical protein
MTPLCETADRFAVVQNWGHHSFARQLPGSQMLLGRDECSVSHRTSWNFVRYEGLLYRRHPNVVLKTSHDGYSWPMDVASLVSGVLHRIQKLLLND